MNLQNKLCDVYFPPLSLFVKGLTEVDEDGFLTGELDGKSGYVPGNLVEEVADAAELAQIKAILQEKGTLRRGNDDIRRRNMNGDEGLLTGEQRGEGVARSMVAAFDYNPANDSPNENSEVELTLTEGQLITVFGWTDSDGFVKVHYV